jgi:hypothetical protein
MSSLDVRDGIVNFLTVSAATENVIDISGQYATIEELIADEGLVDTDPWLGLEFVGSEEVPITLPSNNLQGRYRETGVIYFHVVEPASPTAYGDIMTRAEALRDLLRGQKIGDIFIESVTPPNFGNGATLNFEGGYMAASFFAAYELDKNL